MSSLPELLPSTGYLLSYALPLFFASLSLTFAGTFLTLDRTRSFPRAYDAIVPNSLESKPRAKDLYLLCGGVGGLASGLAFGVHCTTFLSLLIPAVTSHSPLGHKSFVAVWLIPTVATTLFGGRWRYSAIALSGIAGGCLFSLLVCVLIHPSLMTRLVLSSVFTPLILLLCLLPFPAIQYPILRLANASLGSVGLIISIALMAQEPNWSNPWERYWVSDGLLWGSSQEKGLSAAACILLTVGITSDWFLHRKFGECPDKQWDSYLSKYAANLPNRTGVFRPARGFIDKLFHPHEKQEIIFPDDGLDDDKSRQGFLTAPPAYDSHDLERSPIPRAQAGCLRKIKSQAAKTERFNARNVNKRKREAVKFRPLSDLSDDSDGEAKDPGPKLPWLKSSPSFAASSASGRTLVDDGPVDYDKDLEALKKAKKGFGDQEIPDYSDGEDIAESVAVGTATPRKVSGESSGTVKQDWSPKFLQQTASSSGSRASTGFKPVPATPSLIKAIDRVQAAQRDAYGAGAEGFPKVAEEQDVGDVPRMDGEGAGVQKTEEGPPPATHGGWAHFWREVERKNKASRDEQTSSLPRNDSQIPDRNAPS